MQLAATQGMTPPEPVKEQRPSRPVKAERKLSKSVSRTPRCSAGGYAFSTPFKLFRGLFYPIDDVTR